MACKAWLVRLTVQRAAVRNIDRYSRACSRASTSKQRPAACLEPGWSAGTFALLTSAMQRFQASSKEIFLPFFSAADATVYRSEQGSDTQRDDNELRLRHTFLQGTLPSPIDAVPCRNDGWWGDFSSTVADIVLGVMTICQAGEPLHVRFGSKSGQSQCMP